MSAVTTSRTTASSTTARRLRSVLGASLLVAGAGVLTQFLVGVPGFPRIPPGPIILGAAGLSVLAVSRQRWPLVAGLVAGGFVFTGGLIEGSFWGRLANPRQLDVWTGVVLQWAGLVTAVVSGALAVRHAFSRSVGRA